MFGNNSKNPITEITDQAIWLSPGDKIVAISLSSVSGFALTQEGRVYAWGANANGNVGDTTHTTWPVMKETTIAYRNLEAGEKVIHIEAGEYHSFAVTNYGRVYGFGSNHYNQLGLDQLRDYSTPTDLAELLPELSQDEKVISTSVSGYSSYLLTNQGRLFVCGFSDMGKLFTGDCIALTNFTDVTNMFGQYKSGEKIIQVLSSTNAGYVLTNYGSVYSVGRNEVGQLGNGTYQDSIEVQNHVFVPWC